MSCSPLSLQKKSHQSIDTDNNNVTHKSLFLQCNRTCMSNAASLTTTHHHRNQTPTASLNGKMFCINHIMQQKKVLHLNLNHQMKIIYCLNLVIARQTKIVMIAMSVLLTSMMLNNPLIFIMFLYHDCIMPLLQLLMMTIIITMSVMLIMIITTLMMCVVNFIRTMTMIATLQNCCM